ncbi:MAG: acetyl-CoA C-acyltransferase [Polyangiales bacterium]
MSRREVDAFALRSQQRAAVAIEGRRFERSLVPVRDPDTDAVLLARDELPRPNTTLEALASLAPSFASLADTPAGPDGQTLGEIALAAYPRARPLQHVHTAGNSSGIVDGAAAVAVASEDFVRAHGIKPRARIVSLATVGTEPLLMLTGPAPASARALKSAGMTVKDIDLWEINEAFAAVVLQTIRALGVDPERVNVNGGAIALGHPLGATGAMLVATALDELERSDKQTALVTMCIGGGQGIATILERV